MLLFKGHAYLRAQYPQSRTSDHTHLCIEAWCCSLKAAQTALDELIEDCRLLLLLPGSASLHTTGG